MIFMSEHGMIKQLKKLLKRFTLNFVNNKNYEKEFKETEFKAD